MIDKRKILLPVEKRIILHLAENKNEKDKYEVKQDITQHGIAKAICIRHEHVSRSVIKLIKEKFVFVRSMLIYESQRRTKAYFLTDKGLKYAKEIKKNELREISLRQLNKNLKPKLKPLEVFRYMHTALEPILDLNDISRVDGTKQYFPDNSN